LKYAEIKAQVLYREWMLLKQFEQTDRALADKLANKIIEKTDIEARVNNY
jgi:hypothetical protein